METELARTDRYEFIKMPLALMVILWLNYGCFTLVMPVITNYVRWTVYLLWLCLALAGNAVFIRRFVLSMTPLAVFYLTVLFGYLHAGDENRSYLNNIAYLFMVFSIVLYYHDQRFLKFQRLAAVLIFLDYIAVGINTYIQLGINPQVSRYLSTTPDTVQKFLGGQYFPAIGSYGYFYSLTVLLLFLSFVFLHYHRIRLPVIFLFAGTVALLIQASFTMAILLAFLFLAIFLLCSVKTRAVKLLCVLAVLITFLILAGSISSIFGQLSRLSGISKDVSVRFAEISQFFSGQSIGGTDLNSRQQLALTSWNTFLQNPVAGTFGADMGGYTVVGGHNTWADMLASWGFCGIPFFLFLLAAYRYTLGSTGKPFRTFINVSWLYFMVLGLVNTLLISNIFVMWFAFLPFATAALPTPEERSNS